jgi:hypothetical protein
MSFNGNITDHAMAFLDYEKLISFSAFITISGDGDKRGIPYLF